MIDLKHGDCLELMKGIPDGSVDLVLTDPPYGMSKGEWDKFKYDKYISFMGDFFKECGRILKDNGQMYFFHNDFLKMADLAQWLRENTGFVFSSLLIFPKPTFRPNVWKNPSDDNTLRSWFNICEFALHYINGKSLHTEWDKTGWERIKLDTEMFHGLRRYSYEMKQYIEEQENIKLTAKYFADEFGNTGISHFLANPNYTQWRFPDKERYDLVTNRYNLRDWSGFREYEDLRREYEDLRPVHNLDAEHNNVWNVKWTNTGKRHPCEKPVPILERMVNTSSKPGAVIIDPFMGSGSTGIACLNTGRNFIGIEKDDKYFSIAKKRIETA